MIDRQKMRTSAGKGEDTQVGSIGIFLDRGGIVIYDMQISVVAKDHAIRRVTADAAEYAQVRPVGREFLDEITSIVRDIRVTSGINDDSGWDLKPSAHEDGSVS